MKFSKSQNMERQASLKSLRQALEIWSKNGLSYLHSRPEDFEPTRVVPFRFRLALFLRRVRSLAYLINFLNFFRRK